MSAPPAATPARAARIEQLRLWAVVAAVPVFATVVGVAALPRPVSVQHEQATIDRAALGDAVSGTPRTPTSPVEAVLGGAVRLRGADLPDAALSRGARLRVVLHFEAVGAVDGDWQIFLHIDSEPSRGSSPFRIHGDHYPVRGRYRTHLWQLGEHVRDTWESVVPMDAPAGVYDVWAGLYKGPKRLPFTGGSTVAHDGEGRIRVGRIVVE
jgi:hypothetical protein